MYSASLNHARFCATNDRNDHCQTSASTAPGARKRRIMLAFLCALGTVVTTTFTFATDIKTVLAFGDEGAAAFFRNDRVKSGGGGSATPRFYAPAPSAPSVLNNRPLKAAIPLDLDRPSRGANAKSLKAKRERADKLARIKQSGHPEKAGKNKGELGEIDNHSSSSGTRSVCVRLCDGYHFPVGNAPDSGGVAAHEAVCSATCPGAPTRLFVLPSGTDDISKAYSAREGRSYSSLPVALRHTAKHDNTCKCRRNDETYASLVSLYRDFTLRAGDAVMTPKGFQVFKGARQWPYKARDFAVLNASSLGQSERCKLQTIESASVRVNASLREQPLQTLRTTASPIPSLGPFLVKRDHSASAEPVANRNFTTAQAPGGSSVH